MIPVILLSLVLVILVVFVVININMGYEKPELQEDGICPIINNTNNTPKKLPKNYYRMNCGNIVKNTENRFYLNEKIY